MRLRLRLLYQKVKPTSNPHPGIVAPDITESGYGTRAVTGSRGYGDAFFGWFLNNVSGYAGTWLDNSAPGTH